MQPPWPRRGEAALERGRLKSSLAPTVHPSWSPHMATCLAWHPEMLLDTSGLGQKGMLPPPTLPHRQPQPSPGAPARRAQPCLGIASLINLHCSSMGLEGGWAWAAPGNSSSPRTILVLLCSSLPAPLFPQLLFPRFFCSTCQRAPENRSNPQAPENRSDPRGPRFGCRLTRPFGAGKQPRAIFLSCSRGGGLPLLPPQWGLQARGWQTPSSAP